MGQDGSTGLGDLDLDTWERVRSRDMSHNDYVV